MKKWKNKDWLFQKYHIEKLSGEDIANICDINTSTVYRQLEKFNIKTKREQIQAKKEIKCDFCGKMLERQRSKIKKNDNNFCSKECHNNFMASKKYSGKNNPLYNKQKVKCDVCDKEFEKIPSEINDNNFCSKECFNKFQKKERKTVCDWCGEIIERMPSQTDRCEHNFCDFECYGKWKSENIIKEKTNFWKGGVTEKGYYYGCNWEEQREKTLKRDGYKCQLCDSKKDLVVHHKRPLRTFDKTKENWYKKANDLDNLITLCRSCHSKQHHNEKESMYVLIGVDR